MAFNIEMLRYFANKMWRKNKDTFVSKETGKSLSTNDYTNEDKNKLDNLSAETTTYDMSIFGKKVKKIDYECDALDTFHNSLKIETSVLPYKFSNGNAVVYNNEIHILGGSDSTRTKHYKYDGTSWTEVGTLPYKFINGDAVVLQGVAFILGSAYDKIKWAESDLDYNTLRVKSVYYQ